MKSISGESIELVECLQWYCGLCYEINYIPFNYEFTDKTVECKDCKTIYKIEDK